MKLVSRALIGLSCVSMIVAAAAADPPDRQRRRSPVVDVFEQCRNTVVNISTTRIQRVRTLRPGWLWDDIFDFGRPFVREQEVTSVGSGVVIHENGYIVTNAHVVAQASDVRVIFADERTAEARIVASDREHDLAVLKIETDVPLPYVTLGRSADIMVGETVVAIGNPLGLQHTVTAGIVSALDRDLHFSHELTYSGLIQTDAAINPGNSGGPLLNVNAELIGINTAIRGDAQNVGFAIPVDRLWDLLPAMLDIERTRRVRFGLEVSGPEARVAAVHPDSPAAQAGLRPGDRITDFQGHRVRGAIDYYVRLLEQKPGQPIRLGYRRGQETRDVQLMLQTVPPPDGLELAQRLLGVRLGEFDAVTRRKYDLPRDVGVFVDQVEQDSPADRARIVPGDVILRLNRVSVQSVEQVGLALEDVRPGEEIDIDGLRVRTDSPFVWSIEIPTRR
jgi:serine protease Do